MISLANSPYQPYRFGRFELQPVERRLLVEGQDAMLGSRAFDLLTTLLDNEGKLLTKTDLIDTVWPNLVVEENNLHKQMSILRKVLDPAMITTVSGAGYRFTASIERVKDDDGKQMTAATAACLLQESMKILLIDDHALIRDALRGVIGELTDDALMMEAWNCAQALLRFDEHPDLDLVLLDLSLPDGDGFELLDVFRQRRPLTSIVVMSANNEPELAVKSLELGAVGFIPKSTERDEMLNALRLVFAGNIYIPPMMARSVT
ncbi:MAG: response regulator [Pseudomonadota bacterium]